MGKFKLFTKFPYIIYNQTYLMGSIVRLTGFEPVSDFSQWLERPPTMTASLQAQHLFNLRLIQYITHELNFIIIISMFALIIAQR